MKGVLFLAVAAMPAAETAAVFVAATVPLGLP